jgi:hypothetical protein
VIVDENGIHYTSQATLPVAECLVLQNYYYYYQRRHFILFFKNLFLMHTLCVINFAVCTCNLKGVHRRCVCKRYKHYTALHVGLGL